MALILSYASLSSYCTTAPVHWNLVVRLPIKQDALFEREKPSSLAFLQSLCYTYGEQYLRNVSFRNLSGNYCGKMTDCFRFSKALKYFGKLGAIIIT